MRILDHIDNIILPDNFPIINFHSLNYQRYGIFYLAKKLREEEIKYFKLGSPTYEMTFDERTAQIMNFYNWFTISLHNYIGLIGFVDYVVSNRLSALDLGKNNVKKEIRDHCRTYIKKIAPQVRKFRHKVSAHHSIYDPHKDDNYATMLSSVMNNVIYRSPYFEVSLFPNSQGAQADIEPWILTTLFEELAPRFWPDIQLDPIPEYTILHDVHNGIASENNNFYADAHNDFEKAIEENKESKDIEVLKQLVLAYYRNGHIYKKELNWPLALINFQEIGKYSHIEDDETQLILLSSKFNMALIFRELNDGKTAIHFYNDLINQFKDYKNYEILDWVGKAMLNASNEYELLGKPLEAMIMLNDGYSHFKSKGVTDLKYVEIKILINKLSLYYKIGRTDCADKTYQQIIDDYSDNLDDKTKNEIVKAKRIIDQPNKCVYTQDLVKQMGSIGEC